MDIADLDVVRSINETFPIDGFTTNPNLLAKAKRPLNELFPEYRNYIEATGQRLFVQVTAEAAGDMAAQARALKDFFGPRLVVKLPATREGYRACRLCAAGDIPVCVTVIHSMAQALMAARAGAEYVAPYISHIDNDGADGPRCVDDMVRAFQRGGLPCKVLGASFRTVDQINRLAVAGCHAVTITPEMFGRLIAHPSTDVSMQAFREAWRARFGDGQVTDFLQG